MTEKATIAKQVVVGLIKKVSRGQTYYLISFNNSLTLWTLPMGKVESGENLTDALIREMAEELDIQVINYLHIMEIPFPDNLPEGTVNIFYIVDYVGNIKNKEPDKHKQLRWCTKSELRQLSSKCFIFEILNLSNIL